MSEDEPRVCRLQAKHRWSNKRHAYPCCLSAIEKCQRRPLLPLPPFTRARRRSNHLDTGTSTARFRRCCASTRLRAKNPFRWLRLGDDTVLSAVFRINSLARNAVNFSSQCNLRRALHSRCSSFHPSASRRVESARCFSPDRFGRTWDYRTRRVPHCLRSQRRPPRKGHGCLLSMIA
jgi:hypothetical protein